MKTFLKFLNEMAENRRLPLILIGLSAEVKKCSNYEEFRKDYLFELKHGLYWHWTDNPNFTIDPSRGPRDLSSMGTGGEDAGRLMITSDLKNWASYGKNGQGRQYAAVIDMSEVPRNSYRQVSRGFGNEFIVLDPSKARVIKVVSRSTAFRIDREQSKYLPGSEEELEEFYNTHCTKP